ncbi:MAG TPA: LLM class F420-dependent oxidoreductase [Acidimicrobiia bacterium]|nr:LLM class F420-dependent oxidoreductase [Acidimicrobiia bacterium]
MLSGIMFANAAFGRPSDAAGLGRIAEQHGIESLWTIEHTVVPADYQSRYPYSADGRMPGGENGPMPDPLIWLAFVAASTERLRLATGIVILPQRNPVILAKEAATLDVLSNGRFTLGVGVGWLAEEFAALGVPFDDRGRRTDEYITALRSLWREDEPTFSGEFASFERALSHPKPTQQIDGAPSVPIVIGGHTKAAARRAGRIGDGFFPGLASPTKLEELINAMRVAARDAGR